MILFDFPFFATLGSSEGEFSILDISGCPFQYLADTHPTPGHQLKNQPVPGFDSAENDFIHYFLFQNGPSNGSRGSIELIEHGGVTGASEIGIKILDHKVENEVS